VTPALHRVFMALLAAVYVGVLVWIYRSYIIGNYAEYPALSGALSFPLLGIALLALATIPLQFSVPSRFFYSLFVLILFVPMCVILAQTDTLDMFYFAMVAASLTVIRAAIAMPLFRIPGLTRVRKVVLLLVCISGAVTYGWLVFVTGGPRIESLESIYVERLALRDVIVGPVAYLVTWLGKILLPFFIGLTIFRKQPAAAIILILLQLSIFLMTSHRIYIVMVLAILGIYWLFKRRRQGPLLIAGAGFVMVACVLAYEWFETILQLSVLVQRGVFKPAFLNFAYVEVFRDKAMVLMSNSSLVSWIDYPFSQNPAFLVGEYVRNNSETRSNTGFLGSGFAHFHYFGPPVIALFVGALLRLLDSVSTKYPVWIVCVAALGPFTALTMTADFLPALLTHGTIFCLMLLWVMNDWFDDERTSTLPP